MDRRRFLRSCSFRRHLNAGILPMDGKSITSNGRLHKKKTTRGTAAGRCMSQEDFEGENLAFLRGIVPHLHLGAAGLVVSVAVGDEQGFSARDDREPGGDDFAAPALLEDVQVHAGSRRIGDLLHASERGSNAEWVVDECPLSFHDSLLHAWLYAVFL